MMLIMFCLCIENEDEANKCSINRFFNYLLSINISQHALEIFQKASLSIHSTFDFNFNFLFYVPPFFSSKFEIESSVSSVPDQTACRRAA